MITVQHNYKPCRFRVEQLATRQGRERWKVTGRNGVLLVSNNRPVLLRHHLKYRPVDWRLDEPVLDNRRFLEQLYAAIDELVYKVN